MLFYKLVGRVPVPCDLDEWHAFMSAQQGDWSRVETVIGPYRISTVFLWLDHQFFGGEPLLFETMIFADQSIVREGETLIYTPPRDYQTRCATWPQAEAMHAAALAVVNGWVRAAQHEVLHDVGDIIARHFR